MTPHVRAATPSDVDGALLAAAQAWLAANADEALGAEARLASGMYERLFVAETDGGVAGVSVAGADGMTHFEADGPATTARLFEAVAGGTKPRKLTVGARTHAWLRPLIAARFDVVRSHDQFAMRCDRAPPGGRGRWATMDDVADLARYRELYAVERRTTSPKIDWATDIAARATAVVDDDAGRVAAVVRKSGKTARFACIGGTFTFPEARRRGHATAVTAFLVGERLRERPEIHLIVDDDNVGAIALYEKLGFLRTGATWTGYLEER